MNIQYYRIADLWIESKKMKKDANPTSMILTVLFPDKYTEIVNSFTSEPENVFELINSILKYFNEEEMNQTEKNNLQLYIVRKIFVKEKFFIRLYNKYKSFMYKNGNYFYLGLLGFYFYKYEKINYYLIAYFILRHFVEGTVKGRIMNSKEENFTSTLLEILDLCLPLVFIYLFFISNF